jgi:sugar lactone lactonase YvrE
MARRAGLRSTVTAGGGTFAKERPMRFRTTSKVVLGGLALAAAYLVAWPTPIAPVAWEAPAAPALEGPYARNDRLAKVEWLGRGSLRGPESVAVDARGRVHAGTLDGRIVRFDPATGAFETVASTGGRPLGLAFDRSGNLFICDARRGLLSLAPTGEVSVLATEQGGVPFRFPDDVDVGSDGTVYFTDASSRFGIEQVREDVLEHAGRGRLLAWRPATRKVELLLGGLQFANGVALAGDESYVLVNETGAYRVTRFWLAGPKKGTSDVFIDNLPGLPDNVTYSRARHAFWVALYSPRVPALDLLAPHPFLRKVVWRLPMWTQPQPARKAFAIAVDERGRVVENLQDPSPASFAPVTSVREHEGFLYLGSLEREALARLPAPPIPP